MADKQVFNTNHFEVNIEGLGAKNFVSVEGLGIHIEAITHKQGSDQVEQSRKGKVSYSDLVLTRQFDGDKEIYNWVKDCVQKQPVKKSGSVILRNDDGQEVMRWNFNKAWPVSYEPPSLSTNESGSVTVERIVVNVESLEME